jgi:hypothetical protein
VLGRCDAATESTDLATGEGRDRLSGDGGERLQCVAGALTFEPCVELRPVGERVGMVSVIGEQMAELLSDGEESEHGCARRVRRLLRSSLEILVHDYSLRQFRGGLPRRVMILSFL